MKNQKITPKYKLVESSKKEYSTGYGSKFMYRIEALRDFSNVKKEDIGGWVAKESNLSHEGDCWVYGNARVFKNAKVSGNAKVADEATLHNSSQVFDDVIVYGEALLSGNSKVYGTARVCGNAQMQESTRVYGHAWVADHAQLTYRAQVFDNAIVQGYAFLQGNAQARGYARVSGRSSLVSTMAATKTTLNFESVYNVTVSDDHIRVGCVMKTKKQWANFLKSSRVINTKRGTTKFEQIENAIRFALSYIPLD